ncbi:MAG: GAF domain-containing sensor histidine kinase, partial [Capsulimonadales bacterium]|nr:GAF domain-containing sensor histidine kinase [Capsulimonadales bacterium]
FRTRQPLLTGNVSERKDFNPEIDRETGYHTESMMTVPVKRMDGDPIGVMQMLNARVAFNTRDLEVLEILCNQAATGIEHIRLTQEVRRSEIVHVIGDISHDIKNMLTPIVTGVRMLEPMLDEYFAGVDRLAERCPEPETWGQEMRSLAESVRHDYVWLLDNMVTSAEQVRNRTREIADAVKGEIAPPLFEETDFNELCRTVLAPLKIVAEHGQVRLLSDLDPLLPPVECDRKQMINALYNLVNNAIPFTPPGGSVVLRTRIPESGAEAIVCEVQDTGTGMPEHVRRRLFTDEAVSTTVGGTGLGTRYVGKVIQRHHGLITVRSELGVGSVFTLTIPLRHTGGPG